MFRLLRVANITMGEHIRAIWPFLATLSVLLVLMTDVPQHTGWLPNLVVGE
jgi:TRAP-type C4-dicarboxylate transport system permease large subunit